MAGSDVVVGDWFVVLLLKTINSCVLFLATISVPSLELLFSCVYACMTRLCFMCRLVWRQNIVVIVSTLT